MKGSLSSAEEQLDFIYNYERNFVIPLKIGMILVVTVLTYVLNPAGVFTDPKFYNGYIVAVVIAFAFAFYFYTQKDLKRLKVASYLSFAHDIAFVTYFLQFTGGRDSILHFAFAMHFIRAAVSYQTVPEVLLTGLGIFTPLYLLGLLYAERSLAFLYDRQFYIQYGFLWGVIVACFSIVSLLGRQKDKIKNQLKEIATLQQHLIQTEKLAGLGQLAGGVAHELNNPLGSILGFAQMLMRECDVADPKYRDLSKIENAALRCKRIIESLLSFSRQGSSEMEYVNLNGVIEDTLALCQYEMEKKGIQRVLELDRHLPLLYADAGQLQQVFMNLFLNALDAMKQGGTLTIQTQLQTSQDGESVLVFVKDTGEGIAPEILPKIFDPFFTTKGLGHGTGLGLSIVYGIMQRHHGKVEVKSKVGEGTEFVLRFPVLKKGAKTEEKAYA